ncbi:MAG: PIN domain-containing protein [Caldilineaceae bacterium]
MILIDTGPLVALLDADDANHASCLAIIKRLPAQPFLTTWPCFTEAMYWLGEVGGFRYQAALWRLYIDGRLILHDFTTIEVERMALLMEKYQDTPMDLADASLIVVAESRTISRILTIDKNFYIYRLADGSTLEIIR